MAHDTLILFPGALGDFLCLWPTLQILRARDRGRLAIVARTEVACLLSPNDFDFRSIDRREVADLFADSPLADETRALFAGFARIHTWMGFRHPGFAHRLQMATGGRASLHAFRGMHAGEHAASYYARCIGVAPEAIPLVPPDDARRWAEDLLTRRLRRAPVLAIHPGSGSPRKNWEGMAEIAQWWRTAKGSVVALAGPAEIESRVEIPNDAVLRSTPLDRVAAVLAATASYLGNDSGISHLAGLVGASGTVLFGPSDPLMWRPLGAGLRVLHAPTPCDHCGPERFCVHRLAIATVRDALTLS